MIVGLTGLYCAGKNHVGVLLEKHGIPVLDADKLGHEVINHETDTIVRRFGREILGADGTISRKHLGNLVFGRPNELAGLEAIIHPGVNRLVEEWVTSCNESQGAGLCAINAALLHKSSIYYKLAAIIVVKAPFLVRFFRAIKRDKLPLWELVKRFFSQKGFPRYKTGKTRPQLFSGSADIYTIQNFGFPGFSGIMEKQIETILIRCVHKGFEPLSARKLL